MKSEGLWAVVLAALMVNPGPLFAQVVQQPAQRAPSQPRPAVQPAQVPQLAEPLRPNYVMGPGDVIQIRGLGEEIGDRTFRIEDKGEIELPVIGVVRVAGQTVEQFQAELNTRMSAYYVNPRVIVTLVQFRSEPVFFVGAFNAPGIYPLQGRRTLVEMLTLVGGLAPNASRRIRLTRRKEIGSINLPSAVEDASGKGTTVEIPFNVLSRDINPPEDLVLMPYDVVSVEKAELVYVTGEVTRPGGYELGEKESVSAVEMLSLAGGPAANADLKKARILRPIARTGRRAEIPLNLKEKLEGAGSEISLMGGDVLYVPRNSVSERMNRILMVVVPAVSALLVAVLVQRNN